MKQKNNNATQLRKKIDRSFVYRGLLIVLVVLVVFMGCLVFTIGLFYHWYLYQFKLHAKLTDQDIVQLLENGLNTSIEATQQHKNILLLGTDEIANRSGDPVLTDTMMLFSLDIETGRLRVISLPRDLWSVEYKTKINSLYEYGKVRFPERPETFTTQVISELTNIPIHHTVVLSLDQLSQLIDLLGGIEVDIPESFVDEQFPRTDVDIRIERDPAKLYQTVTFEKGLAKLSGERALQFVRSRHSLQLTQGTDDARTIRQQLVINALITKMKDPAILKNPTLLGSLFKWYQTHFSQVLAVEEIIALTDHLRLKLLDISLEPQTISVTSDSTQGVLVHPPIQKYQQWVYEIRDTEQFKREVQQKLGLN